MRKKQSPRVLLLLLPILLALAPYQDDPTNRIVWLAEPNTENFPAITLPFQLFDATHKPIVPTAATFTLHEDKQEINDFSIEPAGRLPLHLVYVIDLGRHFNAHHIGEEQLHTAVTHLTQNKDLPFREGVDTVSILARVNHSTDQTDRLLPATQSIQAINTAVAQIPWQNTGQTDGLAAIQDALDLLGDPSPDQAAAIIYIGSLIDDANGWSDAAARRAEPIAAYAQAQQIPIHVIHTQRTAAYADPFHTLTDLTGGHYLHLQDSLEFTADLTEHHAAVFAHAQTYQFSYTTPHPTSSGTRNVTIASPALATSETRTYTIELGLPTGRIRNLIDGQTISRAGYYDEDNNLTFEHDTVGIEVELRWPDEASIRPITAATIQFNHTTTTLSDLQSHLQSHPDHLTIPWDLTPYQNIQTDPSDLTLTLIDDLGREITLTTPQVTLDATPPTSFRGWIWLLIFLLLSLIGLIYFARHNPPRLRLITAIQKPLDIVRKTIVGGAKHGRQPIARIAIEKAGREIAGQKIDMLTNKITLGRNPKLCDVQLFAEDIVSTISGHHCSIHFDPAQQRFFVTDNHSANGTSLNSKRLDPAVPYLLAHDDILVLGDLFRQGAQLRFETAEHLTALPEPAEPTDLTFDLGATEIFLDESAASPPSTVPAPPLPNTTRSPEIKEDDSWLNEL